ncbi:MAG: M20 family metallopeptidase [Bacteroidota bacterium]
MEFLKEKIKNLANLYQQEAVVMRRHIHMHPELAFEEHRTAEYVIQKLKEFGVTEIHKMAKTGVVALIHGNKPDAKTIAVRADMDALPMEEANTIEYHSRNKGAMHACGHDAHTSALLTVARILTTIKNDFSGTVKLIFQPSEEKFPGGASVMIAEGVLENPRTAHVLGMHVLPTMDSGKIGFGSGMYMASTDEIYLTVKGKGGHGATPELVVDPIVIASHIVIGLQNIVSRKANPAVPTLLTFGRILGEGRTNIIPDEVSLEGTFRTFNETWRAEAHEQIKKIACGIAESMGGSCDVRVDHGYPFLVNDDMLTQKMAGWAGEYYGKENVEGLDKRMTSEDFAFYSQQIPSCFYRIGSRKPSSAVVTNLHSSTFDIDEELLGPAAGYMVWAVVNCLKQ